MKRAPVVGVLSVVAIGISLYSLLVFEAKQARAQSSAVPIGCCDPRTRIATLPYTISVSGSYIVVRDLNAHSAADGITVTSSDVTLDFLGFTLDGMDLGANGIIASSAVKNVTIVNGTVRRWTKAGIDTSTVEGGRVENLHIDSNNSSLEAGIAGLRIGTNCTATHCSVVSNGDSGIRLDANCLISDCAISYSNGVGILTAGRSVVRGCVLVRNGTGIRATGLSTIIENNIVESVGNGIEALVDGGGRIRIDGNSPHTNRGFGVYIDPGITQPVEVIRNHAFENDDGNYSVPASDGFGPPGKAATSMSPWANLSY